MDWSRSSNRVADAALFPTLYSPSSWALSRDHRPPQDWPNFEFGARWRHKFLAPDSSEKPLRFLTSVPWPQPRVPVRRQLQRGNDALHQGGMRSVLLPYFVVNLFVIYTGDPRRDDGERPAIWSWFSLVGSHVGDYDLHFCFSTIYS